ncbi:MAG: hypothetical protein ACREPG_04830 [Candidatus Binatia bacterium]
MRRDEILPVLLRDTSLVAIYHSACQTPIADRKTAGTTAPELSKKRNFVGFYDGRKMENLPSPKADSDPTQRRNYQTFAWFSISANQSGELAFSANKNSAAIDIFLDDEYPAAPVANIVSVGTRAK